MTARALHQGGSLRAWADCPLCRTATVRAFAEAHGRSYGACDTCGLIHLAPEQRLASDSERARYTLHQNTPEDLDYRAFLRRVADPLMEQLPRGAEGLDFGSGPGPTLSEMLGEAGFCVKVYDPFFAPDAQALNDTYDFITCTETAEHFFHPAHEFDRLHRMLRPGGWLALMTEHYEDQPFEQWWYARDPTHACFYRARTMTWLADHYRWRMVTPHRNVRMFQRGTTDSTEVSRDTWVP